MKTQHEAIRLADALDSAPYSSPLTNDAATELRRLIAVNEELLEVLKRIAHAKADRLDHAVDIAIIQRCASVARAAIARAGGEA